MSLESEDDDNTNQFVNLTFKTTRKCNNNSISMIHKIREQLENTITTTYQCSTKSQNKIEKFNHNNISDQTDPQITKIRYIIELYTESELTNHR